MDSAKHPNPIPRIGTEGVLKIAQPHDQYRAVRSACSFVLRPPTYAKGINMLMQLVVYPKIAQRAKLLVYAALESAGSTSMATKSSVLAFSQNNCFRPSYGYGADTLLQILSWKAAIPEKWK